MHLQVLVFLILYQHLGVLRIMGVLRYAIFKAQHAIKLLLTHTGSDIGIRASPPTHTHTLALALGL